MAWKVLTYLLHEPIISWSKYCLLHCLHGTTWLPLDGFSWNLKFFWKYAEKIQVSLKCDKNSRCFTWRSMSFMMILCWIIFRMWYVSDKSCVESQNVHLCSIFFSGNRAVWDNVKKYGRVWCFACLISKVTDTPSKCVILPAFHGDSGYVDAPQCYIYDYTACLVASCSVCV